MKNSMKGLFVLAGARPRKPAQYFFTSKGLERCSKDPVDSLRNLSNMARNSDDLEEEKETARSRGKDSFHSPNNAGKENWDLCNPWQV